jgi:hypothetical protein
MRHSGVWGLWCGLIVTLVAVAGPVAMQAQVFPARRPGCCDACTLPVAQCHCAQTRPVVQTQWQPQQVTTLRQVSETHVRRESYVEQIPITTTENVTVDEGGYQMVWVPKPVTRQVAKTVMTSQVKTRDVPYTVTRQVPEVSTRMVPVQTVHAVTEIVPTMSAGIAIPPMMAAPVMHTPMVAHSGCQSCASGWGNGMGAIGGGWHAAHAAPVMWGTALHNEVPMMAALPTDVDGHAFPVPAGSDGRLHQATESASSGDWQTIRPRTASAADAADHQDPAHDTAAPRVPLPRDAGRLPVQPMSGRFRPAPTAAAVWSAQGSRR